MVSDTLLLASLCPTPEGDIITSHRAWLGKPGDMPSGPALSQVPTFDSPRWSDMATLQGLQLVDATALVIQCGGHHGVWGRSWEVFQGEDGLGH